MLPSGGETVSSHPESMHNNSFYLTGEYARIFHGRGIFLSVMRRLVFSRVMIENSASFKEQIIRHMQTYFCSRIRTFVVIMFQIFFLHTKSFENWGTLLEIPQFFAVDIFSHATHSDHQSILLRGDKILFKSYNFLLVYIHTITFQVSHK